jgi:hypothetical protein
LGYARKNEQVHFGKLKTWQISRPVETGFLHSPGSLTL